MQYVEMRQDNNDFDFKNFEAGEINKIISCCLFFIVKRFISSAQIAYRFRFYKISFIFFFLEYAVCTLLYTYISYFNF